MNNDSCHNYGDVLGAEKGQLLMQQKSLSGKVTENTAVLKIHTWRVRKYIPNK